MVGRYRSTVMVEPFESVSSVCPVLRVEAEVIFVE
jgi:hypothetical protein